MTEEEFEVKKFLIHKYYKKCGLQGLKQSLINLERYNAKIQNRPPANVTFKNIGTSLAVAEGYKKIVISNKLDLFDHFDYISAYDSIIHEGWHVFQYYICGLTTNQIYSDKFVDIYKKIRYNNCFYVTPKIDVGNKKIFDDIEAYETYISYRYCLLEREAFDVAKNMLEQDYNNLKEYDSDVEDYLMDIEKEYTTSKAYTKFIYGENFEEKIEENVIESIMSLCREEKIYENYNDANLRKLILSGRLCFAEFFGLTPHKVSNNFAKNAERVYNEYTKDL